MILKFHSQETTIHAITMLNLYNIDWEFVTYSNFGVWEIEVKA
jgi:hypothetical protein